MERDCFSSLETSLKLVMKSTRNLFTIQVSAILCCDMMGLAIAFLRLLPDRAEHYVVFDALWKPTWAWQG